MQTEILLAKLVEMTALLGDRETKFSALAEFVRTRSVTAMNVTGFGSHGTSCLLHHVLNYFVMFVS